MIEPEIVVDKRGPLELRVLFDRKECDWTFEDRGIEIVGAVERKTVQTHGNDGGDGSHVQEGFGQRPKGEGLIYPGNDPGQIKLNLAIGDPRDRRCRRSGCRDEKQLQWKDPCCSTAVEGRYITELEF